MQDIQQGARGSATRALNLPFAITYTIQYEEVLKDQGKQEEEKDSA
jgi:hypothetical protein